MEFWGVEVLTGKPLVCDPGEKAYVHVSQASLGEAKSGKGNERVILKVKAEGREVVIGTLSYGRVDQIPLDLIFDKGFILSHNSTSSVYFAGYKTEAPTGHGRMDDDDDDDDDDEDDDDDDDEDTLDEKAPSLVSLLSKGSGQRAAKSAESDVPASEGEVKPSQEKMRTAKSKPEIRETKIDDEEDDDQDSSEEESNEEQDGMVNETDEDGHSDDDDDDDDDDSNEEIKPQSVGNKRPLASVIATGSDKKAKLAIPLKVQKSDEQKKFPLVVATKQEGKAKRDASGKKTKENTVKTATPQKLGQYTCQPCKKTFQTESALSQHNSAKHK